MRKSKSQDPRELKRQADMLAVITGCLEKYMHKKLKLRDKKVDGRALDMAQRGIVEFFEYYNELQKQPNNSEEKAKLENIRKHAEGLISHLQGPAKIPTVYLDNGGAKGIEYLEGNPALLHRTTRDDLEEWLEALPVVLHDSDRSQDEPPERLDLFNLNQVLRRIQAWSEDAQTRLDFAGKPKGGAAIAKPRRCLIKALMNTWELATGLPVREGYHGSNDHGKYKGVLFSITRGCLVIADHRPQSNSSLGQEMDRLRLAREQKGFFLTHV